MSVFQIYEIPQPNYAAEEAAKPPETPPVEPVAATTPASPIEGELARDKNGSDFQDELSLSYEARDRMLEVLELRRQEKKAANARAVYDIHNGPALRELLSSFATYDNSRAIANHSHRLAMFSSYGSDTTPTSEANAVASLRAAENEIYATMGISRSTNETREAREAASRAIDLWLAGEGVFQPQMLNAPSSDGFRFTPLSDASQMTLRAATVLSTYERARITEYLRELANLTPNDFMFYDPTGLEELALSQRREFLARVEQLLTQAETQSRAAELRYQVTDTGTLAVETDGIADENERRRLEALSAQINTYYGQLNNSVRQYNQGIISNALD